MDMDRRIFLASLAGVVATRLRASGSAAPLEPLPLTPPLDDIDDREWDYTAETHEEFRARVAVGCPA